MVVILSSAPRVETGTEQERRTSPLMCTEQAPHCAMPQPYLVPVRPIFSRNTHRSGVSPSTFTVCALPLIVSFMKGLPGLGRRAVAGSDQSIAQPKVEGEAGVWKLRSRWRERGEGRP